MRTTATGQWIAAAALLAALALFGTTAQARSLEDFKLADVPFGGDFSLTAEDGETRALSDYRGRVVVIFFGYTACPDICPLTLVDVAQALKQTDGAAERVQALFVSLDPERDTVPRLREYTAHFHEDIVGMTGSPAEVKAVAARYGTRFQLVEGEGEDDYTLAHTGYVYLLDAAGKVRYALPHDVGAEMIRDGIQALLEAS